MCVRARVLCVRENVRMDGQRSFPRRQGSSRRGSAMLNEKPRRQRGRGGGLLPLPEMESAMLQGRLQVEGAGSRVVAAGRLQRMCRRAGTRF